MVLLLYSTVHIFLSSYMLRDDLKISSSSSQDDFSACLLVMDDNHYLIEWLAYHYHTVNLRNLIITSDDSSMTSPNSILERWKGRMDIIQWSNTDYISTPKEFQEMMVQVKQTFGDNIGQKLIVHRARQRLFYYKCMKEFKRRGKSWVLLTDTDEFVRINYDTANDLVPPAPPIEEPGSVATLLKRHARTTRKGTTSIKDNAPLQTLQASPCIQIPRIRFAGDITNKSTVPSSVNGFKSSDFLTLGYTKHANPADYRINKISKTIIDLSLVNEKDLVPVDSIHMPIRSLCRQRQLHIRKNQSLLLIHHYLGSLEQFTYRDNDARNERTAKDYHSLQLPSNKYTGDDDVIQPWLEGFVKGTDFQSAPFSLFERKGRYQVSSHQLLQGVGQLQPKSWYPHIGPPKQDRCALCFFGLPRAYKLMALPSIVRNLLIPNARHNCDIYVHYFKQFSEEKGRRNRGGIINPDDVFGLELAAKNVSKRFGPIDGRNAHRIPNIAFTYDTDEQFLERRKTALARYHNTLGVDGRPAYFPWAARTYLNSSLDNMVRQWHAIECSFKLMDYHAKKLGVTYSRVGMFRNDAMYLTPIDIAVSDRGVFDTKNQHFVTAPFARYPINDRMIYGPYEAVKIWATKRFDLIEERVALAKDPGYEMHSEKFLNASVFPAMERLDYTEVVNPDICFVRTRPDEAALISDCNTGGFNKSQTKALAEDIVKKKCTEYQMGRFHALGCGDGIKYYNGRQ